MTIDVTTFHESTSLIQTQRRTFYSSKIPRQHPQLKNFISTYEADIIYFASGFDIYAIHTPTKRRVRIATLSFVPQCLGAAHGWICVGGLEEGNCAFVNVGEHRPFPAASSPSARQAEVDALLPLDLDPHSRIFAQDCFDRRTGDSSRRRRPRVHYHEFGGLIVNAITVHKLRSGKEGLIDEIVAVIANNDHTVRIYSVTQSQLLQTLEFPTPMNHASISPDGGLLVACGDRPQAFFCKRSRLQRLADTGDLLYAKYDWHKIAESLLPLAITDDTCFSTAFSPSGHICAVAAQGGTITIFDTRAIREDVEADEAIIDILRSSRPAIDNEEMAGAVRSMAFSPEPLDLFAWAENCGRVCVTDLRDSFQTRQTIELEVNGADVDRVNLFELDDVYGAPDLRELDEDMQFIRRHGRALDAEDHLAAINHAADYMEFAAERRRIHRQIGDRIREAEETGIYRSVYDRDPVSTTETERQRHFDTNTARQHVEQSERDPAFSINYSQQRTTSTSTPTPRSRHQDSSTGPLSSTPTTRNATNIHQFMRERTLERALDRPRSSDSRNYQPRRRSSVVISNSNPTNPSSSSHPSSLAPIGTTSSTFSASPSRLASSTTSTSLPHTSSATASSQSTLPNPTSTNDPWRTISAAMANSSNSQTPDHIIRLRYERELERERDRQSEREWERERQRERDGTDSLVLNYDRRLQQVMQLDQLRNGRLRGLGSEARWETGNAEHDLELLRRHEDLSRRDGGILTMGIGWGVDGRSLFVGTEEGIVEFRVNILNRKTFPAVGFR